jgi:predicted nicotinamide N-methyase
MEDLADYKNSSKKRDISGDEYVEGETATNCSNTHSNSTNNPASRRRKVKSSSQNSSQLREPNETSSAIPERNINISVSLYFQTTKQSNSRWKTFRHELTLCDPLLLFYPQRNFTFSFGDILISQSSGCIFSTIWDAEVILAHFLDDSKSSFLQNAITNIVKPSVTCLELGAGCGLAGVVFHRAASALVSDGSVHVIMQEIDEDAVAYCGRCVQEASIGAPVDRLQFSLVASKWGDTTISGVCTLGIDQVDIVLMADVFYHTDHFLDLLITIKVLLRAGGSLMFAFEQRRKDLLTFVQQLVEMFQVVQVHEFLIDKDNQAMDLENAEELDFNPATIFVFTCCNKIQ